MKKILLGLFTLLICSGSVFAQPSNYYMNPNFGSDGTFTLNTPVNGFVSRTIQATSASNTFYIEWDGLFNEWYNNSINYDAEFTLTFEGLAGLNNTSTLNTNPTIGHFYIVNINGLAYSDRQGVIMETDNAPIAFDGTTPISALPATVYPLDDINLTVTLSGSKSSQERVFIRYSDDNFASSSLAEVSFASATASNGSVTIPGSYNTAGKTVNFYAYSTTVSATSASNHDLITLALENNGGSNYTYIVESSYATSGTSTAWSATSTWGAGKIPPSGVPVTIDHAVNLDQDITIASLTIASGVTFTASDGSPRIITINRDAAGSATTVTNSGGTWDNGTGGSTVVFAGTPNAGDAIHQTSGTLAFENITIEKTGGANNVGVDFQANSSVSSTLKIGNGGYVTTAPPASFYGTSAILEFGTNYVVNSGDFSWSTTEIPQNITISSGTLTLNEDRVATGSLIVSTGAILEVAANSDLTIGGNFDLDGTINLRATSSGYAQLKVDGTLTDDGTFNHEQYFTGDWQMVAASMNATSADYFGSVGTDGGTANTQNLFSWDGTQYVNVASNAATITPGQGYFGYVGTNGFRTTVATHSFTGTPNTSVTPSLNYLNSTVTMSAGSNDGWNLVANPFTCTLDFTTLSRTNVNDAFYIYNQNSSNYVAYSGGGISPQGIAPMQSFWVQASAGGPGLGTLTMSTNGTVASAPQLYKNSINFDRLVLRTAAINDSSAADYTVVSFVENNSNHAYDGNWDARKLYNGGESPNIYSTYNGEEMAVNAIDFGPSSTSTGSIDISYRAPHVGNTYEISFDQDYMLYRYMVVLEDKKTGTFTDLSQNIYQFNFDDNYIDRFVLHFSAQSVGLEDLISNVAKTKLEVWAHEGAIHYQANYGGSANLNLIDLSGKSVWSSAIEFNQGERGSLDLGSIKPGVYLLESTNAEGISQTTKVYLK